MNLMIYQWIILSDELVDLTCEETRILTSPNYPEKYNGNEHLAWTVKVPDGNRIFIYFEDFVFEEIDDRLSVKDATDPINDVTFTGEYDKLPSFISQGNSANIYFDTDSQTHRKGFNMNIKCFNAEGE